MVDAKKIVLTGATRGLGRALTEVFAGLGHTVCGCGRSADGIEALRRSFGAPHQFAVVDVKKPDQIEAWADEVLADGRAPDLLINNAAIINAPAPLWMVPVNDFSDLVDVNIKGVFYSLRAFLPAMVARKKGVVVNLSSGWGRSVSPEVAPYCASKYAIEGLSKALAEEVPAGMAVVPLNPGVIDTEMLRTCFGESAANHATPEVWAKKAATFILRLGPSDNGRSLSV
jgi:NAD(P)-dependent dehydrogenase (short-subunit alcohol dehydrogenase family)